MSVDARHGVPTMDARDTAPMMVARLATAWREARRLAQAWDDAAPRLRDCVIRPLGELVTGPAAATDAPVSAEAAEHGTGSNLDRVWSLARDLTELAAAPAAPAQAIEAAAALQDLALRAAREQAARDGSEDGGDAVVAGMLAELARSVAGAPAGIRVACNGPYLVTAVDRMTTHLGEPVEIRPHMALCRCGASRTKPFCDGSHAGTGFTGDKDPKRVPDHRDRYPGASVTVLDNRGLCQHSGFCTDRLNTVFHAGREPFVTPSGGRMDEIINAVRACPSGALSFAIDGHEVREHVDHARTPAIEVSLDGPYRVTGGIALTDGNGAAVERPQGASTEHYALCRCGQSQNKPFCSGMHWYVGFADPPAPEEPTLFQWAGGYPALLRVTKLFYSKYVPQDPLLAPLFAAMSPDHPERVASWLSEVFGGPPFYSGTYGGYTRMLSEHLGKCLTEEQRGRWVSLMCRAADEALLANDAEFRAAFVSYIEWGTRLAVENSQPGAVPPPNMPMPRWWWVCNATPSSRISALAKPEAADEPVTLPAPGEAVGYAAHIKALFRRRDRDSMKFVFDLWSYEDTCEHADVILQRVAAGTMPCDGTWPVEWVQTFRNWIEEGKQP